MSNTTTATEGTSDSPWAVGLPHGKPWDIERITKQIGQETLNGILQSEAGWCIARSRAGGAWDANQADDFAAYQSLTIILRRDHDAAIAEARTLLQGLNP
jgi:hypothetical protein